MGDIITDTEHGSIDLNPVIQPIIDALKQDPGNLMRESNGKIYVVTDEITRLVMTKAFTEDMRRDGRLFQNVKYADAIATFSKDDRTREKQMKHITEMEELIYVHLRSLLNGKESDFFGQDASSCFDALRRVSEKNADISSPQSGLFPDAKLARTYPGTRALLRVPRHTLQISGDIPRALKNAVQNAMRIRLSEICPDDEIDATIEITEKDLKNRTGRLNDFIAVLVKNAYGRIRRTYACCVLRRMANLLPENSPAIPYVTRVCDFNELVQGTLTESGLTADDLVLEFPTPFGRGTFEFDLMTEFAYSHSLNPLPFWITFSELLSEETHGDRVTTTMGQHIKMNGKVPAKGFASVFEYHLSKLESLAREIKAARKAGKMPPGEETARRVLRIAVMYYIVFRDDPEQYRDAGANYKAFRNAINGWTAEKKGLDEILTRIAKPLKAAIPGNKLIRKDFKELLQSRKPDNEPLHKETLYLVISRDILSDPSDMDNAIPIVGPPAGNQVTSYLRFLGVSIRPGADDNALIKEDIRFTESLRYLKIPETDQRKRGMRRDINRKVIPALFTPRNNELLRLSIPFEGLTKLIIAYDRDLLHGFRDSLPEAGPSQSSAQHDDYIAGLAQLIHLLLVYGVLKAVSRIADNYGEFHGDKPMMLMLSLFSTSPQAEKSVRAEFNDEENRGFTHDAHKAVEHIVRQHIPTKSQGFRLERSADWEKKFLSGQLKKNYPGIKEAAYNHIRKELGRGYRFWNIITGLSSGMDTLWTLPDEPVIKRIALISVTARPCDRVRKRSPGDRSLMFGHLHRFTHETAETERGEVRHFYRHHPIQALCDDMDSADAFRNPSILFRSVKKLYAEGFKDVLIVTKAPFTRRIRMTTYSDSTYTNPTLLEALHREMPDLRVYPLFTQKSFGVRLDPGKSEPPMFIPQDPENDVTIQEQSGKSTLFRVGSVVTCRVVRGGEAPDKLHSGITDYLFRCYPETMTIQTEAMSAWTTSGDEQACLHEILRFLHANAYQKSVSKKANQVEKPLEAKLDALDAIIGDDSVGQHADTLKFPKPGNRSGEVYTFSVNIIALLKHLENQSDLWRQSLLSSG